MNEKMKICEAVNKGFQAFVQQSSNETSCRQRHLLDFGLLPHTCKRLRIAQVRDSRGKAEGLLPSLAGLLTLTVRISANKSPKPFNWDITLVPFTPSLISRFKTWFVTYSSYLPQTPTAFNSMENWQGELCILSIF